MWFGLYTSQHEKNIAQKRSEREAKLSADPDYKLPLTQKDKNILARTAPDVVGLVKKGELKPRDILLAYGKRAFEAQNELNCLTEVFVKDAEQWAEACNKDGPLAGFPISLKDTVGVEGLDSSMGMSKFVNKPFAKDSAIVRLLKDAGAVPFVKTNIPYTLLSFESVNDIFGTTDNPHVSGYSAGGSSGGEAALIAFGGSRLGIGTDVAGSVRIPAHFSGIYSIRCSTERFPKTGSGATVAGQEGVGSINSPMTRTLEDLKFFLKAVISMKPWKYDHTCIPLPWREVDLPSKLKVGVMWDDGVVAPTPAAKRALEIAVDTLREQGHEIVDFNPPSTLEALKIGSRLMNSDGAKTVVEGRLWGEKNDIGFGRALTYIRLPRFIRRLYAWFVRTVLGDQMWGDFYSDLGERSVYQYFKLVAQRDTYRAKFFDAWTVAGIDVLLTVPNAAPAFPAHKQNEVFSSFGYTFLFNILDYSAGVMPVTKVDKTKDALPPNFNLNKMSAISKNAYVNYNPEKMHGLPLGVQVVGTRLTEERVLDVMQLIEDGLNKKGQGYQPIKI